VGIARHVSARAEHFAAALWHVTNLVAAAVGSLLDCFDCARPNSSTALRSGSIVLPRLHALRPARRRRAVALAMSAGGRDCFQSAPDCLPSLPSLPCLLSALPAPRLPRRDG
jgi:hypothetical protein